jgi:hypothetical protein
MALTQSGGRETLPRFKPVTSSEDNNVSEQDILDISWRC